MSDEFKPTCIIGCDECGYGSLAGSLVIGGVRAATDWNLEGLNDSKKLSEKKRLIMEAKLLKLVEQGEIVYYLGKRTNQEIDSLGMAKALKECYVEVFHQLHQPGAIIVTDGILKFEGYGIEKYHQVSIVKADSKIPTVMAASILAKTHRDAQMKQNHLTYPDYDWINNMGYGSPKHLAAIKDFGPSPLHRMSYAPMKNIK